MLRTSAWSVRTSGIRYAVVRIQDLAKQIRRAVMGPLPRLFGNGNGVLSSLILPAGFSCYIYCRFSEASKNTARSIRELYLTQ